MKTQDLSNDDLFALLNNASVLITGSRDLPRHLSSACAMRLFCAGVVFNSLLHGDARGADRYLAHDLRVWGVVPKPCITACPADWSQGRGAGIQRNAEMVSAVAGSLKPVVLAAWDGKSRGTLDTMSRALVKGLPLIWTTGSDFKRVTE